MCQPIRLDLPTATGYCTTETSLPATRNKRTGSSSLPVMGEKVWKQRRLPATGARRRAAASLLWTGPVASSAPRYRKVRARALVHRRPERSASRFHVGMRGAVGIACGRDTQEQSLVLTRRRQTRHGAMLPFAGIHRLRCISKPRRIGPSRDGLRRSAVHGEGEALLPEAFSANLHE